MMTLDSGLIFWATLCIAVLTDAISTYVEYLVSIFRCLHFTSCRPT